MRWRRESMGVVETGARGAWVAAGGPAGVPPAGLGVAELRGGCLGGRGEALTALPGAGGRRAGAPARGGTGTVAASGSSACLLPPRTEEGHFETEGGSGSSSFPPLRKSASSSSPSAETDC